MTGIYIPPGAFADTAPNPTARGNQPPSAPFEILKRLAGAIEWNFECLALSNTVANGTPIGNVTPGVPTNYQVPNGMEAMIDYIRCGPNMIAGIGTPTWNASLTANGVAIPGFIFFGQLPFSDGTGNVWMPASVYVRSATLIELRKASDGFGVNSEAVGGFVRGWAWPIRARLDWEKRHNT